MINKILNHKSFKNNPPVIIDLGASGETYNKWKDIYPQSVFVALDGDKREKIKKKHKFKKYIQINKIIFKKKTNKLFYFTKSPYCSSLLKPIYKKTKEWFFHNSFKIIKTTKIKTVTVKEIIYKNKIKGIDIMKIDLQGIDLDILKSIPKKLKENIKYIDIEPSMYGFYRGEKNNVSEILKYMQKDYSIEDIVFGKHIKGDIRKIENYSKLKKKLIYFCNKKSISYMNICFIKKFKNYKNVRDILMHLCILLINRRYSEVYDILDMTNNKDPIFNEIKLFCDSKLNFSLITYILFLPLIIFKKLLKKI